MNCKDLIKMDRNPFSYRNMLAKNPDGPPPPPPPPSSLFFSLAEVSRISVGKLNGSVSQVHGWAKEWTYFL